MTTVRRRVKVAPIRNAFETINCIGKGYHSGTSPHYSCVCYAICWVWFSTAVWALLSVPPRQHNKTEKKTINGRALRESMVPKSAENCYVKMVM